MDNITNNLINGFVKLLNDIFSFLGETLFLPDDITTLSSDAGKYFDNFSDLFMYLAGFILIFGLALNVIHTGVNSDLFTARAAGKICLQFFVGMFFVLASKTICITVIDIGHDFAKYIFGTVEAISFELINDNIPETISLPFGLGRFVDVINYMLSSIIPILLIVIAILITSAFVTIKLSIRSLSLILLTVFSPPAFACLGSDVTRDYFKKWLNSFLQTVLDLIFMAVVYKVGCGFLLTDGTLAFDTLNPGAMVKWVVLLIAICFLMVKPPAILRNLV